MLVVFFLPATYVIRKFNVIHTRRRENVKIAKARTPNTAEIVLADIPEHQQEAMARTLIGCIGRLFENPDVKADYERWKQKRKEAKG